MTIIQGYRLACEVALEVLDERTFDNSSDPEKLRIDLTNIARTTLSSKILTVDKEHFSKIAVDAVMCLKGRTNLEPIHVIKKAGGTLKDSFLAEVLRPTGATVFLGNLLLNNVQAVACSCTCPSTCSPRRPAISRYMRLLANSWRLPASRCNSVALLDCLPQHGRLVRLW
jgi:hypothetical protein